jgi:peptide chain release factor subunit 3
LIQLLDDMTGIDHKSDAPFLMPVSDKYKDMGTIICGKIAAGRVRKGKTLLLMPSQKSCEVMSITNEQDDELTGAMTGDNVRIKVKNIEEEDIRQGNVLCDPKAPVSTVTQFEAQLRIMEIKSIMNAGYNAVLHIHNLTTEVTIGALLHLIDLKTNRRSKRPPPFAKKGQVVSVRIESAEPICVETYADHPQLGRFTLRSEGATVAMGKVTKLIIETETTQA